MMQIHTTAPIANGHSIPSAASSSIEPSNPLNTSAMMSTQNHDDRNAITTSRSEHSYSRPGYASNELVRDIVIMGVVTGILVACGASFWPVAIGVVVGNFVGRFITSALKRDDANN